MNSRGLEMSIESSQKMISESSLIVPVLLLLAQSEKKNNGPLTMAQIRVELKRALDMGSVDLEPLKSRPQESRIDQIIRNLISNEKLTNSGVAEYEDGKISITDKGRIFLLDNLLDMLPMPTFSEPPSRAKKMAR